MVSGNFSNKDIREEFDRLLWNTTEKRKLLLRRGFRRVKTKKLLNTISGVLALFSAGAITTFLLSIVGNNGLQIVAVVTAFIAGIISLILANLLNDLETSQMFTGASAFLLLREKISTTISFQIGTTKELLSKLETYKSEYAELDTKYCTYFYGESFSYSSSYKTSQTHKTKSD